MKSKFDQTGKVKISEKVKKNLERRNAFPEY